MFPLKFARDNTWSTCNWTKKFKSAENFERVKEWTFGEIVFSFVSDLYLSVYVCSWCSVIFDVTKSRIKDAHTFVQTEDTKSDMNVATFGENEKSIFDSFSKFDVQVQRGTKCVHLWTRVRNTMIFLSAACNPLDTNQQAINIYASSQLTSLHPTNISLSLSLTP